MRRGAWRGRPDAPSSGSAGGRPRNRAVDAASDRPEGSAMTLAPLLDAPAVIQFHAAFAFAAIGLGAAQFLAPKGTLPHRTVGWAGATLMMLVAGTSLFIHTIRMWGPWSPIHLLSLFTLAVVPLAVWRAPAPRRPQPSPGDDLDLRPGPRRHRP